MGNLFGAVSKASKGVKKIPLVKNTPNKSFPTSAFNKQYSTKSNLAVNYQKDFESLSKAPKGGGFFGQMPFTQEPLNSKLFQANGPKGEGNLLEKPTYGEGGPVATSPAKQTAPKDGDFTLGSLGDEASNLEASNALLGEKKYEKPPEGITFGSLGEEASNLEASNALSEEAPMGDGMSKAITTANTFKNLADGTIKMGSGKDIAEHIGGSETAQFLVGSSLPIVNDVMGVGSGVSSGMKSYREGRYWDAAGNGFMALNSAVSLADTLTGGTLGLSVPAALMNASQSGYAAYKKMKNPLSTESGKDSLKHKAEIGNDLLATGGQMAAAFAELGITDEQSSAAIKSTAKSVEGVSGVVGSTLNLDSSFFEDGEFSFNSLGDEASNLEASNALLGEKKYEKPPEGITFGSLGEEASNLEASNDLLDEEPKNQKEKKTGDTKQPLTTSQKQGEDHRDEKRDEKKGNYENMDRDDAPPFNIPPDIIPLLVDGRVKGPDPQDDEDEKAQKRSLLNEAIKQDGRP